MQWTARRHDARIHQAGSGGGVSLLLVPAATAVAQPQKLTVPMDGVPVLNVCSTLPDVVLLSGAIDLTVDARTQKGGIVSGKVSYNAGGLKGTGLWGSYVGNGTGNVSFKVKDPYPASAGGPGHFFLLMPGANNDLKASFLLKFKVQGNGTVSEPKIEIRQLECGTFDLLF